jgi:hypothetical protein
MEQIEAVFKHRISLIYKKPDDPITAGPEIHKITVLSGKDINEICSDLDRANTRFITLQQTT